MLLFVRQFLKDARHTGSIWPSSRHLAAALTRSLRRRPGPRRVLEVGPGTGPVTRAILNALEDGDELHIVEINPAFCCKLEADLLGPFRARQPGVCVTLHCGAAESVPLDGPFDSVVCSLPFNNFRPALVRTIFKRLLGLLEEDGELTYFEYVGARIVKAQFTDSRGRQRLRQIHAMGKVLRRRHAGKRELVLSNFPPAFAMRLRRGS